MGKLSKSPTDLTWCNPRREWWKSVGMKFSSPVPPWMQRWPRFGLKKKKKERERWEWATRSFSLPLYAISTWPQKELTCLRWYTRLTFLSRWNLDQTVVKIIATFFHHHRFWVDHCLVTSDRKCTDANDFSTWRQNRESRAHFWLWLR